MVTFATDLYQPVIDGTSFSKTVIDLNGGSVRPGDVLEYTVTMTNTGQDDSTATVLRDTLPANVTYVAGSLSRGERRERRRQDRRDRRRPDGLRRRGAQRDRAPRHRRQRGERRTRWRPSASTSIRFRAR